MRAVSPALVGALTLIVGFGVADVTGVRALGGIILIIGGAWCAVQWHRLRGPVTAGLLVLAAFLGFVISHPLGRQIGSWPSVFLVAAVVGVIAWLVAERGGGWATDPV